MKTVDNEAGVKFARKGYYKGVEVTVTHRYGSQVWLEDYPIKSKGNPTEYGCWVEGESVTYKDDIEPNQQPKPTVNNRKQRRQNGVPKAGINNVPNKKLQNKPKGNNVGRSNRGASRKT